MIKTMAIINSNSKIGKVIEFGTGDILMAETEQNGVTNGIVFLQGRAGAIGRNANEEYPHIGGQKIDDIAPEVLMTFTKSSSARILIEHLESIERDLIKWEAENNG
jgi:hypothetical protein